MTGCPVHHHGIAKASGCEHTAATTFSKLFANLTTLNVTEQEAAILGGPGGLMHDFDGASPDCEIPAGYIFFAQFIDHDITLDTTTMLGDAPRTAAQVAKLPNIRSASLDLDCVYGFGPEASPHIYDAERPGRLAVNPNGYDLARSPGGAALIGDPRNDENIFVSQLHLMFHRFHNKLYNERVFQDPASVAFDPSTAFGTDKPFNRFEEAERQTRYHYQWLVLFDFLKRLCDPDVFKDAAEKLVKHDPAFPYFYAPDAHGKLTMPVEFSVAAYRVGHTMVRSVYAVNDIHHDVELFDELFGTIGFSTFPQDLTVDWHYMLPVDECLRPRMCKAIDPLLADEIQDMPRPVVNSNNPNNRALAFRNLRRGNAMGLPSGQAVAGELATHYSAVDANFDLQLANAAGWDRLDAIGSGQQLRDNTPLFYYILRESQIRHSGQRLGPVGSAILMEVFGGMLHYCKNTFIHDPNWNPDPCVSKERYGWFKDKFKQSFNREALIENEHYYPFDLADVVRFVQD